jgi:hypothetical protein
MRSVFRNRVIKSPGVVCVVVCAQKWRETNALSEKPIQNGTDKPAALPHMPRVCGWLLGNRGAHRGVYGKHNVDAPWTLCAVRDGVLGRPVGPKALWQQRMHRGGARGANCRRMQGHPGWQGRDRILQGTRLHTPTLPLVVHTLFRSTLPTFTNLTRRAKTGHWSTEARTGEATLSISVSEGSGERPRKATCALTLSHCGLLCAENKGSLLAGLEAGMKGMCVGEKRRFIIPPELGFDG